MLTLKTPDLFIAGCGPGSRDYVTPRVTMLVMRAQLLAGVPRLLDLFPESPARRMPQNGLAEPWLDRLEATPARPCVILVPGNPGSDPLTHAVISRFGRHHCRIEPGISVTQLACATLALDSHEVTHVDLQWTLPEDPTAVQLSGSVALFQMGAKGAEAYVAALAEPLHEQCIVIEDLSLSTQNIERIPVQALAQRSARTRRIVVVGA